MVVVFACRKVLEYFFWCVPRAQEEDRQCPFVAGSYGAG